MRRVRHGLSDQAIIAGTLHCILAARAHLQLGSPQLHVSNSTDCRSVSSAWDAIPACMHVTVLLISSAQPTVVDMETNSQAPHDLALEKV